MSSTIQTCPACSARNRVADDATGRPRCAKCRADLPWIGPVVGPDLDRVLASSPLPTLVDLWAPWCGPCRSIAPVLERLAVSRAGRFRVVKVNVDDHPDVSARLGVQGIPTLVLFDGGREVGRQVGAAGEAQLSAWIDGVLARA